MMPFRHSAGFGSRYRYVRLSLAGNAIKGIVIP
jgi:hypothetical protein